MEDNFIYGKKKTFTFMSMFGPVEKALQALMAHRW